MRMVMTVIVVAALLAAFFVPVLAMTPEPTHSNGAAAEEPATEVEPVRLLMAVLPGGRVLEAVVAEGKDGAAILVILHRPGGSIVAVMPW